MTPDEERRSEAAALRERLSRLSEASRRINESLDLETVLQDVLDSARALTGARYGLITLLEAQGGVEDYLTSGFSAGEAGLLSEMPEVMRLYEHLGSIAGPLRVGDLPDYIRGLGLPDFRFPVRAGAFLSAPVRHQRESMGNIYLAKEEGGAEFSLEDEETLLMFASQAALVIANARRHRQEQKARADLETLVETSPVGVVVFDAGTGAPVSFNRETRRIVEGLRTGDNPPERLLEELTVKRADGQEFSLMELSLAQLLSSAETLRAEEMVLQVPDGRSVAILVNATPIRSQEGEVESVIVTVQDMTPLEELERLRAEFLGMVSHELRAPLTSIKGSAATLIGSGDSLDPAELLQFHRIIEQQADHMQDLIKDLLDVARIETGTLSVAPAPADAAALVDLARNYFLSGGGRNNIRLDLEPDLPEVMADRRRIVQVLGNLLSNAARHSPETADIWLAAVREGVHVAFSVADNGIGVSAELLPYLFRKHSRIDGDDRSGIAGSGLGLAICKGIVEAHGGRIRAESGGPGMGARFTFTLPAVEEIGTAAPGGPVPASSRSRQAGRDRTRVLVVDDDPQTLRHLRDALTEGGYAPVVTADPEAVGRLIQEEKPHLVLLDLMLPGTDGIALLERVPELAEVPVIFLSGYGRDQVVARALEAGAEDYIVKPFSPTELAARIQTVLRRRTPAGPPGPSGPFSLGELSIDYARRRVTVAGRPVLLTDTEYRLLMELSVNAGLTLSLDHLLQRVWGPGRSVSVGHVRTVVKNLRRKLGDDADNPSYVFTDQRVGYRMANGETQAAEPP